MSCPNTNQRIKQNYTHTHTHTLTRAGTEGGVLAGGADAEQGPVAGVGLERTRTPPVALRRALLITDGSDAEEESK